MAANINVSSQNWNNLIDFVKLYLGAEVELLEIDEYKIKQIIETVTLPYLEPYVHYIDYFELFSHATLIRDDVNQHWKIDKYDRKIVNIRALYTKPNSNYQDIMVYSSTDAIGAASNNYLSDLVSSMVAIKTWVFHYPDVIELITPFTVTNDTAIVVEAATAFKSIDEIPTDIYTNVLRKLAVADVVDYIVAIRSRFENITTPSGQIQLNVQGLQQIGDRFRQEAQRILEDQIVPEKYMWWIS